MLSKKPPHRVRQRSRVFSFQLTAAFQQYFLFFLGKALCFIWLFIPKPSLRRFFCLSFKYLFGVQKFIISQDRLWVTFFTKKAVYGCLYNLKRVRLVLVAVFFAYFGIKLQQNIVKLANVVLYVSWFYLKFLNAAHFLTIPTNKFVLFRVFLFSLEVFKLFITSSLAIRKRAAICSCFLAA